MNVGHSKVLFNTRAVLGYTDMLVKVGCCHKSGYKNKMGFENLGFLVLLTKKPFKPHKSNF